MISVKGTIKVKRTNGKIVTIDGSEFELENVSTDTDRSLGTERIYEGLYEDAGLEVTLSVSEYPVGGYNSHDIEVAGGVLIEDNMRIEVQLE